MFFTIPYDHDLTRIVAIPLDCGRVLCAAGAHTCNLIATVMFMVLQPPTGWMVFGAQAQLRHRPSVPSSIRLPTNFWFAHHCWYWCTMQRADVFRGSDHHRAGIAISALREWMAARLAQAGVAAHMLGKLGTTSSDGGYSHCCCTTAACWTYRYTSVWGTWLILVGRGADGVIHGVLPGAKGLANDAYSEWPNNCYNGRVAGLKHARYVRAPIGTVNTAIGLATTFADKACLSDPGEVPMRLEFALPAVTVRRRVALTARDAMVLLPVATLLLQRAAPDLLREPRRQRRTVRVQTHIRHPPLIPREVSCEQNRTD